MALPLARLLVPLAALALLAGCASPAPQEPAAPEAADLPAEPTVPGQQEELLAWLASGVACAHSTTVEPAIYASMRPELDGITYASAAVDPASIGLPWKMTVAVTPTLLGFEVGFWSGAVGSGELLELTTILPPFDGNATGAGIVPDGADVVSLLPCSAEPGTAEYLADLAQAKLALL